MIHDKKVLGVCGETSLANAKQSIITMMQVCVYAGPRWREVADQLTRSTNTSSPITWQRHSRVCLAP